MNLVPSPGSFAPLHPNDIPHPLAVNMVISFILIIPVIQVIRVDMIRIM